MYIDPSGLVITLTGNDDEKQTLLSSLQVLTPHKLFMNDDSTVSIEGLLDTSSNEPRSSKGDLHRYDEKGNGTKLIERLIRSEKNCIIQIGNEGNYASADSWNNASNGTGSDMIVTFNPNSDPNIMTVQSKTGNVTPAKRPAFIGLAHELIHADRGMRGGIIDLNTTGDYKYQTSRTAWQWFIFSGFNYTYITQNVLREELTTVGLKYNQIVMILRKT